MAFVLARTAPSLTRPFELGSSSVVTAPVRGASERWRIGCSNVSGDEDDSPLRFPTVSTTREDGIRMQRFEQATSVPQDMCPKTRAVRES
jgi:hypothetical protein